MTPIMKFLSEEAAGVGSYFDGAIVLAYHPLSENSQAVMILLSPFMAQIHQCHYATFELRNKTGKVCQRVYWGDVHAASEALLNMTASAH